MKPLNLSTLGIVAFGCAVTVGAQTKSLEKGDRPNVVLIVADDLGY